MIGLIHLHPLFSADIDARHPDQLAAAVQGFFWPKVFWDFLTKNLDGAVKPIPVLQILNLLVSFIALAWEWPLKWMAGTAIHRSIEARLVVYSLNCLLAVLLYQATNPALYYLIGIGIYLWAFVEGEVSLGPLLILYPSWEQATDVVGQMICAEPWSLPNRHQSGAV